MKGFKETKSFNKKSIWIIVVGVVIVAIFGIGVIMESRPLKENEVKTPKSSSELEQMNYIDAVSTLESAGFENVEVEKIEDLIIGFLTKDGEVEEVSINGDTEFSSGSRYLKDSQVVVRYHTFKSDTDSSSNEEDKPKEEEPPVVTEDDSVINIDNNEEFSMLLVDATGDEMDSFVNKYKGRIIEFDGYTWDWFNHTSTNPITGKVTEYETLYDTIIIPGNIETLDVNPSDVAIRVEEVSFPNFTPALNRQNVYLKGKITGYNKDTMQIYLEVIEIEGR